MKTLMMIVLMMTARIRKETIFLMVNFVPREDTLFDNWQRNFVTVVNSYIATWGLSVDANSEWTALTVGPTSKKKKWDDAWAIVQTGEFKHSEKVKKDEARDKYESGNKEMAADSSLRIFITRYIRNNPKVTNDQKAEMGITVPDTTPTPTTGDNAKILLGELTGSVKVMGHLFHISEVVISGIDSVAIDPRLAEIQIYVAYTAATVKTAPDIDTFAFSGKVKGGKYKKVFLSEKEGLRAWYYAIKVTKGRNPIYGPPTIPWSAVIS